MTNSKSKAVLLMIVTVAFAISPWLSNEFGGFDPDRFPIPQNKPPVQPAGYAFSIWGLIYTWLLFHAGYGLLKRPDGPKWDAMRWPLIISLAVGATWLPVALLNPVWAMVLILIMLIGAIWAMFKAPTAQPLHAMTPIAIYAGWLTAASFVSIGVNGGGYGVWLDATGWAWVCVVGLFMVAGTIQWRIGRVPGYGLTVSWALIAVAVQNSGANTALMIVASLGAIAFAALALKIAPIRDSGSRASTVNAPV